MDANPKPPPVVPARPVTIKVSWRRVIQTAPYESETLELGVEDTILLNVAPDRDSNAAKWAAKYHRALTVEGDALTQERLKKVKK